jgi:omega-6 fatty acid desaturase (delta-12 desaturase)
MSHAFDEYTMTNPPQSNSPASDDTATAAPARPASTAWRHIVEDYEGPQLRRSVQQVITTLGAFVLLLYITYRTLVLPYWVTLACALVASGFMMRTFMLMHDCAHGSLFKSRRANDILGFITGVLTLTPYVQWRRDHVLHHASAGDLDRRGHGDVMTLTVREYQARSAWGRLKYRVYRHPLILLGFGPLHLAINQRYRARSKATGDKEIASVRATNIALAALIGTAWYVIGLEALALVYVPVFFFGGAAGIWLFYVQHQFEGTYWEPHGEWDYVTAAIEGSSYLRLPRVLQWMTCSIGLHHVHHLSPRVPNYRLQACHDANPEFQRAKRLTLGDSVRAFSLKLWDEDANQLVGFRAARRATAQA